MHYLMVLAIPISVGMVVLADKIILTVYGEDFATSILPLRILISSLIVVFLNFPVGAFLNACNRQVINTRNMGITVVINVALNLWLIPQYSFNGAAVSAFISGFVLFFLGLRWVGKVVHYDKKFLLLMLLRSIGAAAIMGTLLYLTRNYLTIFVSIPIGALIYGLSLYGLGGISKRDIQTMLRSVMRRFA